MVLKCERPAPLPQVGESAAQPTLQLTPGAQADVPPPFPLRAASTWVSVEFAARHEVISGLTIFIGEYGRQNQVIHLQGLTFMFHWPHLGIPVIQSFTYFIRTRI